ncbi:MAG: hypothetical protein ABH889_00800 [Candidatus Portnoybacteria bacterium]
MAKRLKIRPTEPQFKSRNIIPSKIDDTERVSFNFRRLCTKKKKFDYKCCNQSYFSTLLDRLKNVSEMNRKEMTMMNKKSLRCHIINFKDRNITENTFGIRGEDVDDDAWQFQLTSNKYGRVHGYFVGSTFYVVWFDPKHELYK